MVYRADTDLKFLGEMKSSDLEDLVFCLTHAKDGEIRFTEELTTRDSYKAHHPDHNKYWQDIAAEIQCFGANSVATIFRGGEGVLYKEVLMDVCDKLKVNYNKDSTTERIEYLLLTKILSDALEKMTAEQLKELGDSMGIKNAEGITPQAMLGVFQAVFRAGGFKSYQLTLMIVNAILKALIGRGLSFGGNIILTRTMAILTGPIGWAVTGAWTVLDIASAAYRVTIPAVIQVSVLRQKHLYAEQAEEVSFT